jgi:cobyrinic acid a,c-diamide synthase
VLRGHEFHYSRVELRSPYDLALEYERGAGLSNGRDGIQLRNVYAHYLHLHPATYSVLDALFRYR